jgi:hypothetical protein
MMLLVSACVPIGGSECAPCVPELRPGYEFLSAGVFAVAADFDMLSSRACKKCPPVGTCGVWPHRCALKVFTIAHARLHPPRSMVEHSSCTERVGLIQSNSCSVWVPDNVGTSVRLPTNRTSATWLTRAASARCSRPQLCVQRLPKQIQESA